MASYTSPLPKNGEPILVGDPDHDVIHTQTVDCIEELRTVVNAVEAAIPVVPTADTLSGATAVGKSLVKAASAAAALTAVGGASGTAGAIGAVTGRALVGGSATTASASDHTHAYSAITGTPAAPASDAAVGVPSLRTLGTGALQAAVGSHSHSGLLTGTASAIADSTATDVAGLVTNFNALLAVLRTRGVLSA